MFVCGMVTRERWVKSGHYLNNVGPHVRHHMVSLGYDESNGGVTKHFGIWNLFLVCSLYGWFIQTLPYLLTWQTAEHSWLVNGVFVKELLWYTCYVIHSPLCYASHWRMAVSTCLQWYWFQWRHNEHNDVSNHRRLECSVNRLFRRRSKLGVTGLCEGNPPVTDGFPSQRTSNAENVSFWWRHHAREGTSVVYMLRYSFTHLLCQSMAYAVTTMTYFVIRVTVR